MRADHHLAVRRSASPRPGRQALLGEHLERLERDRELRLRVVVDVDRAHVRLALVPVEPVHVVLARLVEVDRVLVDERRAREQVDLAEDARPIGSGVDDEHVLRRRRPQADLRGREVLARPVPASVVGLADVALPRRGTRAGRPRARRRTSRPPSNGSSNVAARRWASRTWTFSGSSRASSGQALEEVVGVAGDVPVQRRPRPRPGSPTLTRLAPSGPSHLLPGRGDGARVARQDRGIEPADVDAQLERVGATRRPGCRRVRRPASMARRSMGR